MSARTPQRTEPNLAAPSSESRGDDALSLCPTGLRGPACPGRQDRHGDFLGYQKRREGLVLGISENKLQRMLPGLKLEAGLGLPGTEMDVLPIGRNRFAGIDVLVDIDQEMVMAGVGCLVARVGDAHVAQSEPNREAATDPLSVAWIDDVENG